MKRSPWSGMASGSADRKPSGPQDTPGLWPVLRAALIAAVLLLHLSLAAPWPDLGASDLRYDLAADELERWTGVLSSLGVSTTPDQLADDVVALGRWSKRTQKALHGPARPLLRLTGTGQAWGLFAFPDPYPGRLVVMGRSADGGRWQTLYRAPDQGEPWLVDLLQYRKVRGIYDDSGDRPRAGFLWNRLCDELARRIFAHDPELAVVELRFDVEHVTAPAQGDDPAKVGVRHRRIRKREALLGEDGAGTALHGPVGTP